MDDPDTTERYDKRDRAAGVEALKRANINDSLTEPTRIYRRTLLLLASTVLIISVYPLALGTVPLLEAPPPSEQGDRPETVVLMALVYHWIGFSIYGWADYRRWRVSSFGERIAVHSQIVERLNNHLHVLRNEETIERAVSRMVDRDDLIKTVRNAEKCAQVATRSFNSFVAEVRLLTAGRAATVLGWELALPFLYAPLAIHHLFTNLAPASG